MEKVQQAERGLQSCLRLRFRAKLPKAISPKEGPEEQQQRQRHHESPTQKAVWVSFVCFVDSFYFVLQMHLTPNSSGIKNELIPLDMFGAWFGKREAKGWRRTKCSRKTPQVCKFCFVLISRL